jgi:signal transduction histidine kinase
MNPPDPSTTDPYPAAWSRALGETGHDLRTTTGAVRMWLELFERAAGEEDRARARRMLHGTLRHLVRLAEDLQDAAQAVQRGPEPPDQLLDLAQLFHRAGERLRQDAEFRRIDLRLEADGVASHPVLGDAVAWDRTFDRLLEAALSRCDSRTTLAIELRRAGTGLELAIPWSGPGLPPEADLPQAWAAPSVHEGMSFARGLWLARRHLTDVGGGLAVRGDAGGRWLVATLPPAASP